MRNSVTQLLLFSDGKKPSAKPAATPPLTGTFDKLKNFILVVALEIWTNLNKNKQKESESNNKSIPHDDCYFVFCRKILQGNFPCFSHYFW